jgi:murein L,D-transpeptidase YafK
MATNTAPGCTATDRRIVVFTAARNLLLCDRGRVAASYDVHLGRGGVGKTRQGDNKVPLGLYALGTPRRSSQFWIFIPIGYPTPEQRKRGFTGQDVGVHGPHRLLRWLGPLTNSVSSTAGCVGLGADEQIEAVADWVTRMQIDRIEIR